MSNARNISKADSRFVNATGDTMSGALTGQSSISCKPSLTVHGASTSSVPEVRLDMVNYSGNAGDLQGGIVWIGGDASTPGYDTERARIDATLTDQYNRVGLSFKVGAYSNPVPYEVMGLDAHGRVTTPYQPAAFVAKSNGGGFTTHNGTMVFNNVHLNRGNHYNSTTGIFTCPTSAVYRVHAEALTGDSSSSAQVWVYKNGSPVSTYGAHSNYQGDTYYTIGTEALVQCAANDQLSVYMSSSGNSLYQQSQYTKATFMMVG